MVDVEVGVDGFYVADFLCGCWSTFYAGPAYWDAFAPGDPGASLGLMAPWAAI